MEPPLFNDVEKRSFISSCLQNHVPQVKKFLDEYEQNDYLLKHCSSLFMLLVHKDLTDIITLFLEKNSIMQRVFFGCFTFVKSQKMFDFLSSDARTIECNRKVSFYLSSNFNFFLNW